MQKKAQNNRFRKAGDPILAKLYVLLKKSDRQTKAIQVALAASLMNTLLLLYIIVAT